MIRYFAAHPTAANLLMLLLALMGFAALPGLTRETFPDFSPQQVGVTVAYPGASALDVELALCLPIEEALESVTELAELTCTAREGAASVVAELREGGAMGAFLDQVRTEVEAIDSFPEEAEAPVIEQLGRTDPVVSVAVTGPMSDTDLERYADQLKARLRALPAISQVEVQGFSQRQFRVEVAQADLRRYGLSAADVSSAIARQSIDLPVGSIVTREREVLLRFTDQRRSASELADLTVIGAESGAELRLGEIAQITERFDLDEERILFDGRRAALLKVTKTKSEDTLRAVDAVRGFVEAERARAAPGVRFTLTADTASIVRDRLRMLLTNGWQGLVLVFLAMWLFFRLRFAFWVAMGLPVSFLGALFFMSALGFSINMITMVALLIALGLLMDDAIVIAENIAAHLRQGKPALDAAVAGTSQVAPGVIASFLTTVAVFGPLAFLAGDIGQVLRFIPMVLVLVLAVSLIEAFWILPNHLAHALAHHAGERPGAFRQRFDAGLDRFRERVVGRAVDAVIAARYLFVGAVVAVFLVSLGMLAGGKVKFEAFPDLDGDVMEARVLMPQGTPLWRTEAVVARLTRALAEVDAALAPSQPDGEPLVRAVSVRYGRNADVDETGPHLATVSADLLTAERRSGRLDDVINRWRVATGALPDVIGLTYSDPAIGPGGKAIDLRLRGPDLEALSAAAHELAGWLGGYRGVYDLNVDLRPGKPELRLALRDGALALGLDASTIAAQLRAAFQGITADELQVGPGSYEIEVRLTAPDRDSLDDVEAFPVLTAAGAAVPLGAVAVIENDRGWARIARVNGQRTVTLAGSVDTARANAAEVVADTAARFLPELASRFPGVAVSLEGQSGESEQTGASMRRGFVVGLAAVFLLLSFQFRSYVEPLIVMVAIPLALIGVIWGHWLMGLDLSMPSMMGFVSLAGIVVNDSILLVAFLKLNAGKGLAVEEAARRASRERFRAVLLTSLTTIVGLLPLLSERSLQAQVLIPLATSIVFGLLATTVLVLLVVPALYAILHDLGWTALPDASVAGPARA